MALRSAVLGIEGMTCASCSGTVESAIRDVKGVVTDDARNPISVTLTTNSAAFIYDADRTTIAQIISAVEEVGFGADVVKDETSIRGKKSRMKQKHGEPTTQDLGPAQRGIERLTVLGIEGMSCASCSGTVENAIRSLHGVQTRDPRNPVTVTLTTNTARFVYNPTKVSVRRVIEEIESVGFAAELLKDNPLHGSFAASPSGSTKLASTGRVNDLGKEQTASDGLGILSIDEDEDDFVGGLENTLLVFENFTASAALSNPAAAWQRFEQKLNSASGVQQAEAYYDDTVGAVKQIPDRMSVSFDDGITGPRDFIALAGQIGLKCSVTSLGGFMMATRLLKQQAKEAEKTWRRLTLSCALTVPIFCITMVLPMLFPSLKLRLSDTIVEGSGLTWQGVILMLLATPVQFYVGKPFHSKAIKTLKTRRLGMDFLVSTGTTAAYMYSLCGLLLGIMRRRPDDHNLEYFETSSVLITAVLLGKFLEVYAKSQTTNAIHKLSSMKASTARLVQSGTLPTVAISHPSGDSHSLKDTSLKDTGREIGDSDGDIEMQQLIENTYPESNSSAYQAEGGGTDRLIDVSLLHKGDIVRLVAGESVPADGILLPGSLLGLDEAMMTGESAEVSRKGDESVFGGTIVVEGSALMKVTACGDHSTLGRIISTVQEAQATKPPIQELADRVACYFVPVVASISLTTFLLWVLGYLNGMLPQTWTTDAGGPYVFAFSFALAVWVSACPCAFGLATPTAVLVSTGVAAKHGVLVRKGAALQYAANVNAVAFDKTGTLTKGTVVVSDFLFCPFPVDITKLDFVPLSNDSNGDINSDGAKNPVEYWQEALFVIHLLHLAEKRSSHPLAKGISTFCRESIAQIEQNLKLRDGTAASFGFNPQIDEADVHFEVKPGMGVMMSSKGDDVKSLEVLVGNMNLLDLHKVSIPVHATSTAASYRAGGKVAVFMAINGVLRVIMGVADAIREEAPIVVAKLQRQGINCYMITGDEPATALAIAKIVGISSERILSRAKPQDKRDYISNMQAHGKKVAFVGDGTNDSPALASADVGLTMASGSDIAMESGDMVLVKNDLTAVLIALDLSATTLWRIKLNYFWALCYNALLVPIAAGVLYPAFQVALAPMYAGAAMALSSVSIVLSSLLLIRYHPPRDTVNTSVNSVSAVDESNHSESQRHQRCNCPVSTMQSVSVNDEHATAAGILRNLREFMQTLWNPFGGSFRPSAAEVLHNAGASIDDYEEFARKRVGSISLRSAGGSGSALHSASIAAAFNDRTAPGSAAAMEEDQRLLHLSTAEAESKNRSYGSISSLRSGSIGMMGCGCGKGNCKCGPNCRCGMQVV